MLSHNGEFVSIKGWKNNGGNVVFNGRIVIEPVGGTRTIPGHMMSITKIFVRIIHMDIWHDIINIFWISCLKTQKSDFSKSGILLFLPFHIVKNSSSSGLKPEWSLERFL